MNSFSKTVVCSLFLVPLLISGCSDKPAGPAKTPTPREPSVANTVAEEITGYRAVKQGQQLKEKINVIQKEHHEDMSAILDEK